MIGNDAKFEAFLAETDQNEYLEYAPRKHGDEWALAIIRRTINASSGTALQQMPKAERDEALARLKAASITIRQLERLAGINRGVIQKANGVNENRPS